MEKLTRRKFMELTGAAAVVAGASSLTGCSSAPKGSFKLETAVAAAKVSGVMDLVVNCVEGNSPLGNDECHIVFNSVRTNTGTQWKAIYFGNGSWTGGAADGDLYALLQEMGVNDILLLPYVITGEELSCSRKENWEDWTAWLPTEKVLSSVTVEESYEIMGGTYYAESFVTEGGYRITYCSSQGELKYLVVQGYSEILIYEAQLNFESPQVDEEAVQWVIKYIQSGS